MDPGQVQDDRRRSPPADRARAVWFAEQILPHELALRRWLSHRHSIPGLEIDDVIQESYTLLAARECVDDIHNPRGYLFQVAHSLVLRDIRRSKIVPILAMEDLGPVEFADGGVTPAQTIEDKDLLEHVVQVIATMPVKTREAFSLRRIHDVPQREIAQRMGITEKAVEKLIARGIRWVGEWLAREGGNRPARVSMQIESGGDPTHEHTRNQPEY